MNVRMNENFKCHYSNVGLAQACPNKFTTFAILLYRMIKARLRSERSDFKAHTLTLH